MPHVFRILFYHLFLFFSTQSNISQSPWGSFSSHITLACIIPSSDTLECEFMEPDVTCSHFSTSEIDIIYRTTKCFELTGRALVSVFVFIDFTRKYMIIHSNENWKLYWWRKKKNSLIFAVLFNTDNLIQRNYL